MKVNKEYKIKVSNIHTLHVEEAGNPDGKPVVFLHGGPGGHISEKSYEFFDLNYYRVIAFDQRGCGKSTPFACLEDNTIDALVEDMEKIRRFLNIDKWIVFGGSFGSTLALAYAIAYRQYVEKLVLRGIFLGRDEDIKWLYQEGASYFYPDHYDDYIKNLTKEERVDIVSAYYKKLTSENEEEKLRAAKNWAHWEMGLVNLISEYDVNQEVSKEDISLARLECHYFANHMFWENDNYILDNVNKIANIPTWIVHGRYDIDCRPSGAYELLKRLNKCKLYITDASGHSPYENNNLVKLKEIMEDIK